MENQYTWQIGSVNSEAEAIRLQEGIRSAGMGAFLHQIQVRPEDSDGKFLVYVEVRPKAGIDPNQELAQLLAYFFRLHNETHGNKVDLNLDLE